MHATQQSREAVFKSCPKCDRHWAGCDALLADPEVRLLGFQTDALIPRNGSFLFQHEACGTTMALTLESLGSLLPLPALAPSCWVRGESPAFCLGRDQQVCCPLECICEYVWILSQTIASWPKFPRPAA